MTNPIPLATQYAFMQRELVTSTLEYPTWSQAFHLDHDLARYRLDCLRAVCDTLASLASLVPALSEVEGCLAGLQAARAPCSSLSRPIGQKKGRGRPIGSTKFDTFSSDTPPQRKMTP
jgi:hypothetical protein